VVDVEAGGADALEAKGPANGDGWWGGLAAPLNTVVPDPGEAGGRRGVAGVALPSDASGAANAGVVTGARGAGGDGQEACEAWTGTVP
jgi:hypothetical protein